MACSMEPSPLPCVSPFRLPCAILPCLEGDYSLCGAHTFPLGSGDVVGRTCQAWPTLPHVLLQPDICLPSIPATIYSVVHSNCCLIQLWLDGEEPCVWHERVMGGVLSQWWLGNLYMPYVPPIHYYNSFSPWGSILDDLYVGELSKCCVYCTHLPLLSVFPFCLWERQWVGGLICVEKEHFWRVRLWWRVPIVETVMSALPNSAPDDGWGKASLSWALDFSVTVVEEEELCFCYSQT